MHESTLGSIEPTISSFNLAEAWAARPAVTRERVRFTGEAGEYFRIWIVNVALTILTIGIYSAWAKVRTKRYFYSNMRLADSPFEYLAQPIQILKGRLIAYTVVIALWLSARFQVFVVYFPLLVAVLLLMPWVVRRTLAFRARYSAWRGLRFRFTGDTGDAYANYLFRPLILPFTLYLAYPWVRMRQHDYIVSGHRFGGRRFQFAENTEGYFGPYFVMLGLGIAAYIAIVLLMVAIIPVVEHPLPGMPRQPPSPAVIFAPIAMLYLAIVVLRTYLSSRYQNTMWAHTRLGAHRFECTLGARTMIWLYLSNAVAIVATLGMLIPWAMIRVARYRAEQFAVVASGSLDDFVAESAQAESATGAELMGALDMDFDIGL